MPKLKVLIIGAGLGGLALAQSLTRSDIACDVFERDNGPFHRPQGYRLHLDADAINAVREVLPTDVRAVFEATSLWTEPYTTILSTNLSVLKRLQTNDDHGDVWPSNDGAPLHANVDRATLRQCLLAGLESNVHFGKVVEFYEETSDGIIVHFTDGTSAGGHVLVGADGIGSAVRRQRAPRHESVDAGITAIYGRVPIDVASQIVPTEVLTDIFTVSTDERKVFLGLGTVKFPTAPTEAAATFAPAMRMRAQESYVVCIVGGRHEYFPDDLRGASSETLKRVALETIGTWPDRAKSVVRAGDAAAFFLIEMRTSVPSTLDTPRRVTLLGDAVHAMTPTLGRGANLAMRDGALLGRELKKVSDGRSSLAESLAIYERDMLEYGFSVVREAARIGQQRMDQNPLPI